MSLQSRVSKTTTISFMHSVPNDFTRVETCLFSIAVACLSVFTVASNAIVIHLTRTSSELRPMGPLRFLLGSMAWGDLLLGLIIMPLAGQYNVLEEWIFGELGCKLFVCIELACGATTALHLVAIAIDRYLAIMHPIMYRNFGNAYILLSTSITWIIAAALMIPAALFNWFAYWLEENGTHQCDIPRNDIMSSLTSSLVVGIPCCAIWTIYIRLYCMNRKRLTDRISKTVKTYQDISRNLNNLNDIDENVKSISEADHHAEDGCVPQLSKVIRTNFQGTKICLGCNAKIPISCIRSGLCQVCRAPNDLLAAATQSRINMLMKTNRKTLCITLIVTCTFIVCYVPIGFQYQVASFCPACETNARLTTTMMWLAFGMSALNPIIYGIFNVYFKHAFKKFISH